MDYLAFCVRRVVWSIALLAAFITSTANAALTAEDIYKETGVKGGLVVHLGCGAGVLAAQFAMTDAYVVHGLDTDPNAVEVARASVAKTGKYGRASIAQFDGKRLPYADNFVNLLIAEELGDVSMDEVMRALVPRGVAYIKTGSKWEQTTKPWPDEIDEWTHFSHGADGNSVADDLRVGPPKQYQWIAAPKYLRAHDTDSSVAAMVTGGGRIFYLVDEAPISLAGDNGLPDKWFLVARDAFNGLPLWKVRVEDFGWQSWKDTWYKGRSGNLPVNIHRRVVVDGEYLYATIGYHAPVSQIDAATGEVLQVYKASEGGREILVQDGQLILTTPEGDGLKVVVLDPDNGAVIWQTEPKYMGTSMERRNLKTAADSVLNTTADDDLIALIDGKNIVCLDRKSGAERWRVPIETKSISLWAGTLIVRDGVVLYAEPQSLIALSGKDGSRLWSQGLGKFQGLWFAWKDVFIIDGLVWAWSTEKKGSNPTDVCAYDLKSGELVKKQSTGNIFNVDHHHRCYPNKATSRYIIASRRGAEYVDLEGGENSVHHWVRGTCHMGMMPANGLLYAPPAPCKCYFNERINDISALASGSVSTADEDSPIERGPAYGKITTSQSGAKRAEALAKEWPAFRADSERSCSTQSPLPASLKKHWNVSLGGKLAAPIVADGKLIVASTDAHTVYAVDAKNGKRLWSQIAGGRVDSSPTYHEGAVLFGSADGRVTCLRASDGELAWRKRVAPRERLIGVYGQLESAWPVSGSVLVDGGLAYVTAGRSSYVDGGIHIVALDPMTGETRHATRLFSPETDTSDPDWYKNANYKDSGGPGFLTDIMQARDGVVCMKNKIFGRDLSDSDADPDRLRNLGGFLDDTYNQRYWSFYGPNMVIPTYQQQAKPTVNAAQMKIGLSRMLIADADHIYGLRMFDSMKLLNGKCFFQPGEEGYLLFSTKKGDEEYAWSTRVPIRGKAMVVGPERLAVVGANDVVDPADPLAAFEGRKGGTLLVVSAKTGDEQANLALDSPPVLNGMAAANGKLYIAQQNGEVTCVAE